MQNVLMQMGMRVVSVDGMLIRKARQYVLRCLSCFKVCLDMEKSFCPCCGNHTLGRVSKMVDQNGNIRYSQNTSKKATSLRGTIYPIPLPKPGRSANNIVLTEDQFLREVQLHSKHRPKKQDVFGADYAFALASKEQAHSVVVGFGSKNPNVAKRRIGKKNKPVTRY